MYRTFSIKNFRCFDKLTLEGLGRVNLIAGKNNVGKTALLEALWVHHGAVNPELGERIESFRGIEAFESDSFMGNLFRGFDRNSAIELKATGDWGADPRRLSISVQERTDFQAPLSIPGQERPDAQESSNLISESSHQIVYDYLDESGDCLQSRGWLSERMVGPGVSGVGMARTPQQRPHQETAIFLAARRRLFGGEEAARYSQLEIAGQQEGILKILQEVDPSIVRLVVLVPGQGPVFYADTGTGRLVPLLLMGDGMCRLLTIALAIASAPGGMVLVDEIENGLHHSVMEKIWTAVGAFARSYDVQIFATTHSYECIGAAYRAFVDDEEDGLRLFRLQRSRGEFRAVGYDKERLRTVLESNMEFI